MDKRKTPESAIKFAIFLKEKTPGVKKVFLFGSHAKGMAHEDSDIDLAIVFENLSDSFDMQVELMKMRRKFDTRIEPHPFSETDFNQFNPVAREILNHGLEIS